MLSERNEMNNQDYMSSLVQKSNVKSLFSMFQELDVDLEEEKYLSLAENSIMKFILGCESERGTCHIAAQCRYWSEMKNVIGDEKFWMGEFFYLLLSTCFCKEWEKYAKESQKCLEEKSQYKFLELAPWK